MTRSEPLPLEWFRLRGRLRRTQVESLLGREEVAGLSSEDSSVDKMDNHPVLDHSNTSRGRRAPVKFYA